MSLQGAVLVIVVVCALSPLTSAYWGDATWYNTGLGACGWWNNNGELVAAVSHVEYGWQANPNTAPVCGKCANVRADSNGNQVKVKIVDKCMGCNSGSIDLSPAAFGRLASLDAGRIKVSWDYVWC
ncbi:uncharacterized protein LOC129592321 [Paramacrobiotus metropolitanus]|uniref:uncharacterized protein LOC129592321 n=1 Tax=Paramacrobiotus metropolitanus TaxID=2943436 RepID=UPI002446261A|nr:uncharacterized protein LOC129592321 [Paramacrobiotus metropolitanus]